MFKNLDGMILIRKSLKILLLFLGAVLALAAIVGAIAWVRIDQAGGVAGFIEQTLKKQAPGIESRVEEAGLEFQLSATPVLLRARNITLKAEDTGIILPRSEFGFSWQNLITADLIPSEMRVFGLEMEISHGQDGWYAGSTMAMITGLLGNAPPVENAARFSGLGQILISNAKITIGRSAWAGQATDDGVAIPAQAVIEPIEILLRRDARRLLGSVRFDNLTGGRMNMDFVGNAAGSVIDFDITMSGVNLSTIYPYLGVDIPQLREAGRLDGRLAFTIREQRLAMVSGELTAAGGQVDLPGFGGIEYDRLASTFSYDAGQDLLTFQQVEYEHQPAGETEPRQAIFTGQVRDLSLEKPVIFAKVKGSGLPFEEALGLWPNTAEPELRKMITGSVSEGKITSFGLETVGVFNTALQRFDITTLDLIADLRELLFDTGFSSIERLTGRLGSRLELSIGSQGVIDHASAEFLLLDAELKPKGNHEAAELEGIEIRTRLVGNKLQVTRAAIDARHLGQLVLVGQMELQDDWHPHRLDISLKAEQIDKDFMTSLWPSGIRPQTRAWVEERVDGGVINGLSVNAGFDLPVAEKPKVLYLNGKAEISRSSLTYLRTMPPLRNASAAVSFEGSSLRFDLLSGTVEGLDFDGSRFIIRATDQGPQGDLALIGRGDFSGALHLLDHPRLNLLRPRGLNVTRSQGKVDLTMSMKWLVPPPGKTIEDTGGAEINATATVGNASLDGLPYGIEFSDGSLDMVYAGQKLEINGRGHFNKAPGVVSLTRQRSGEIRMDLALSPSEELTGWLQDRFSMGLGGKTGALIRIDDRDGMDELVLDTRLDLDHASINIERFGLTKLPGEKAVMHARFDIADSRITSIHDIDLESEFLAADGRITFDESGRFLGAFFDHISWPGNDISNMTMERNGENILRVDADARIIDLTPLRREESPGEGMSLIVDLTADRIIMDEKASFSGNVVFTTEADGIGEAELLGNLFLNGKPMLTEGTLKAEFGGGRDMMRGRGLIGGAEADLVLGPGENGGDVLEIYSNNAGQVLKTLNVTDAIRRGQLEMKVIFNPEQDGHYDVLLDLENFNVIEAPRAVRMLSVLSLAGLYSLLEGDGTNFREGSAMISVSPGVQKIHQARGTGEALAVDFVGIVDSDKRELEVSGALLPVYGITKLIGKVPLLREILTGIDNQGLFVTQFNITGPIDDPSSIVNASSIIPGVFRDVFSPDWVNRERERLIGSEENSAAGSAK
ncbi:AsmA-like C-terminal domain-containing protein [Alphaproteobacteria bacterium LSUCC0684]